MSKCYSWNGWNHSSNHDALNQLLKAHVQTQPWELSISKASIKDKSPIRTLNSENDKCECQPDRKTWSKNEQIGLYWINAYNAFTVSLIVQIIL